MVGVYENQSISRITKGFTISDVQIIPQIEKVSYKDVCLDTRLTKNIHMKIPFIPSPMDSVMNVSIAMKVLGVGGVPIICINKKDAQAGIDIFNEVLNKSQQKDQIGVSIASGRDNIKTIESIIDKVDVIAIDSLHYNPTEMLETIDFIKNKYGWIDVISGNVTNAEDARRVIESGADAVRIGMTDNSINKATELFGCGRKQGSTLYECKEIADDYNIPIICDGGIGDVKDMPKAIALGASSIMMGRQFAAIFESTASIIDVGGKMMKYYRGMSRKDIVDEMVPVESVPKLIEMSGLFDDVINNWINVLKIVIAKSGQNSVEELRCKSLLELIV